MLSATSPDRQHELDWRRVLEQRRVSLLLGVVLSSAYLFQAFSPSRLVPPAWVAAWIFPLVAFCNAWAWLFAILGFGRRLLACERPVLRAANEAVPPFYILHQTLLLCIGYFVMAWPLHPWLKWLTVLTASFLTIIALYALLIRKVEGLRFLFGMKTTRPSFEVFHKGAVLVSLLLLYIGLTVFAALGG